MYTSLYLENNVPYSYFCSSRAISCSNKSYFSFLEQLVTIDLVPWKFTLIQAMYMETGEDRVGCGKTHQGTGIVLLLNFARLKRITIARYLVLS